jgi:glycosyltransferase involved in cell wall biosynthesis
MIGVIEGWPVRGTSIRDTGKARSIRVIWVCTPLIVSGGGFQHLRGWLRHIDHERFKITLAYASPEDGEIARRLSADGPVVLCEIAALRSADRLFIPGVRALRSLSAEVRPHVVHSIFVQADILAALATIGTGIPQLSSVFGYLYRDSVGRTKGTLYRLGYSVARRRYKRVSAISEATAAELRRDFGVDPRKIVILRSGVDFARMPPTPPSLGDRSPARPTIAVAAQLIPEKQVDLFIRAIALTARERPDVQAVIAGDGPERERLEGLVRELELVSRVRFLGEIGTVPDLLRSVDVVVCAARPGFDGVPRVVLEGMANGAVVISTKVGGVAEVLRDGIDGIVLDRPGPEALSNAIRDVLADADLRRRFRTSALERVALFDASREARELERLYETLAAPATAR